MIHDKPRNGVMDGGEDQDELKARRCAAAELAAAGCDVEMLFRLTGSRVIASALHEVYYKRRLDALSDQFRPPLAQPGPSCFGRAPHPQHVQS
jgi:hypothetical protein